MKENGYDLEKEIRKTVKKKIISKQKKKMRIYKEDRLREISEKIYELLQTISNYIHSFYNNNCTNNLLYEWYTEDEMVHMKFTWSDQEMTVSPLNNEPYLEGGPKKLNKLFLKTNDFRDFIILDQQYYIMSYCI